MSLRKVSGTALFIAWAFAACHGSSPSTTSETHFIKCDTDADCAESGAEFTCVAGHCTPPAATCTASPVSVTEPKSFDSISENVDTTCASVAGYLNWKNGAVGSACTDPIDCSPVCCPCQNGTFHTLATWCNYGVCASPDETCCAIAGTAQSCVTSPSTVPPAASCTATPITVTEPRSIDSISENVDTTCASVAGYLSWKNGATGSACTDPIDCSPVCCPCPNGTHHTLATWCNHGVCASPQEACCAISGTAGLQGCS